MKRLAEVDPILLILLGWDEAGYDELQFVWEAPHEYERPHVASLEALRVTKHPHVHLPDAFDWAELHADYAAMRETPYVLSVSMDRYNCLWNRRRLCMWYEARRRAVMLIAFKKRGCFRGVDRNLVKYLAATIFRERLND